MTALTPQQMRELAEQHEKRSSWTAEGASGSKWFRDTAAALRTAADQLEAVREWADSSDREPNWDALDAILAADTAPQEGRDE